MQKPHCPSVKSSLTKAPASAALFQEAAASATVTILMRRNPRVAARDQRANKERQYGEKVILAAVIPDELALAVCERRVILFAGAGLSMSVGLPSWQQFIEHLSDELGCDSRDCMS
jgi:hypothetical protein